MEKELQKIDFSELANFIEAKQNETLNTFLSFASLLLLINLWYWSDSSLLKYAFLIVLTFSSLTFFKKVFQINKALELFRKENEKFLELADENLLKKYYFEVMATGTNNTKKEEYAQWAYEKILKQLNTIRNKE